MEKQKKERTIEDVRRELDASERKRLQELGIEPPKEEEPIESRVTTGSCRVPMVRQIEEKNFVSRKVEARLTHEQSRTLKKILTGCQERAVRMKNGKFVQSKADAIRLILERFHEETPKIKAIVTPKEPKKAPEKPKKKRGRPKRQKKTS
jgi:hypothetical protein